MHRSIARNTSMVPLLVLSLLTFTVFAQSQSIREADYTVKLFFVFGSDTETDGREMPAGLAAFRTRVTGEYGYKNLRLRDVQQARVSSNGLTEIKGMARMGDSATEMDYGPSFLEWAIHLRREAEVGTAAIGQFRVGIRGPMRSRAAGSSSPVVNYEAVGLTSSSVSVPTGEPVLMEINGRVWGSLPLAVRSGMDFPRKLVELYLDGPPTTPGSCCCRSHPAARPLTSSRSSSSVRNCCPDWHPQASRQAADIIVKARSGVDGTSMPAFGSSYTLEELHDVASYIDSAILPQR